MSSSQVQPPPPKKNYFSGEKPWVLSASLSYAIMDPQVFPKSFLLPLINSRYTDVPLRKQTLTFNKTRPAQVGAPLKILKNAKASIVKMLSISQCRKISKGIRIRLENKFFPTANNKNLNFENSFMGKKSQRVENGA